jgi:hypothetical protein
MRKIAICGMFVLLATILNAQTIGFSYGVSAYQYKFNETTINGFQTDEEYKNTLNNMWQLWYEMEKKVNISAFLGFSNKGYSINHNLKTQEPDPLPLPDYSFIKTIYFDAGFSVGKKILNYGKFSLSPYLVLRTSFLYENKVIIVYNNGDRTICSYGNCTILPHHPVNKLFSTGISIRLNYNIKRFGIYLQPSTNYYFNKPDDQAIKSSTYNIGISLGISYKLKQKQEKNENKK